MTHATMDLSAAFSKAVGNRAPHVRKVFDRFHVQKLANEALDTVRRQEVREQAGSQEGKALKPKRASEHLDKWCQWASHSRLAPFAKLARTVQRHKDGILAYVETGLSNGGVEGINNKIRALIRRAYGFRSPRALMAMILLCCGGMEFSPPLPVAA